ncbi:MAG: C4-type zinc ribbon domain-containing protein [Deltaproteobacteria bacterium]|nr:C4-type zinc ribbon domain-containing protein [Deltaproteobacteria bacterium]
MSLYLKQIEQLISLQKVDDEIHSIRQDLDNAPKELETLRAGLAEITEENLRHQDKMAHLRDQEKRIGLEIEDDSARLKKSKGRLMQVENTREYHAMVREMDSLERVHRTRAEERTALAEELIRQTALQQEAEERLAAARTGLETFEAGLQARLDKAQAALELLLLKREETGREIPLPVFSRYEFIRERLEHPVIVPVSEGICSGCNISIPPQNYIELQKASLILSCPNCQRLMFWDRHFTPEE